MLTEEQVVALRESMASGESIQDCAERANLPYFTLYQIRRGWTYPKAGGPIAGRTRGRMTPAKAQRILALREKGATIRQLANAAGCGMTTIKKVLREGS